MDVEKLLLEQLQKLSRIETIVETDLKGVKVEVDKLNEKMDTLTDKVSKVDDLEIKLKAQEERISKLESNIAWFLRTVGGILIAGAMYVIFGV